MAEAKAQSSIFSTIFFEALKSNWLAALFFANIFLTGFLLPTETIDTGYTLHHWDFIIGISGALLLTFFRVLIRKKSKLLTATAFLISGLGGALLPYLWALIVLPLGIPDSMKDKWAYALNGPVAQIVILALLVGSVKYTLKTSNSVAENRAALNILRKDMKDQIERERSQIVELILATVKPALGTVEMRANSGADRTLIADSISHVIDGVVRPLSHQLDASASQTKYEINRRLIKRDFRKTRIRTALKNLIPLTLAINLPLSLFLYVNFNLTTISYLYGFGEAFEVSAPFLLSSTALFLVLKKVTATRKVRLSRATLFALALSSLQALNFALSIHIFSPESLKGETASFAFTTFLFTLIPSVLAIALYNLKTNLDRESALTSEIAENLSVVRRQLWSLHKKFAREIHGGLQSQLQVIALKFRRDDVNQEELVESLNKELSVLLESQASKPRINNFRLFISELVDFWDGISKITPTIDDDTYQVIGHDSLLTECLHEVIREAVNNAVKHSGATDIEISITQISTTVIELIVKNNVVKELQKSERRSLGTAIYKELTLNYELQITPNRVTLHATLVIDQG